MITTSTNAKKETNHFAVRTRLGRATGDNGRLPMDQVRALPTPKKGQILLEATDGKQAVCLLAPGHLQDAKLVPAEVFPTRRLNQDVTLQLVEHQWQSSEGKLAAEDPDKSCDRFPNIGDVMPDVHPRPFYLTHSQLPSDKGWPHVVLGIDLALLVKVADALGTSKVAMLVPVPVKGGQPTREQIVVNRPIVVCPAVTDDANPGVGVGIVMPIVPDHPNRRYSDLQSVVMQAESKRSRPVKAAGKEEARHDAK